jgi:hypothetical protein
MPSHISTAWRIWIPMPDDMSAARAGHIEKAKITRENRLAAVAHMQIMEHKKGPDIAAALGIKHSTFKRWCWIYRTELDEAKAEVMLEVKRARAGAALAIRAGLAEEAEHAVDALSDVVQGKFEKAADGMARVKAATTIIDRVDPPAKSGGVVNINVFSDKATQLHRAVAAEDLTPRVPLPRPRDIEVEGEIVEDEDGT